VPVRSRQGGHWLKCCRGGNTTGPCLGRTYLISGPTTPRWRGQNAGPRMSDSHHMLLSLPGPELALHSVRSAVGRRTAMHAAADGKDISGTITNYAGLKSITYSFQWP